MKILGASLNINDDGDGCHCININKPIPLIFDVPHLVKSIRNNLKRHPINIQGKEVSWRHLEEFYLKDKTGVIRMAPKLTERHIYLPPFTNMRVKLATQVLSHSVASGMQTMVVQKLLPEEALHTAKFAEDMDRLFDVLNSRSMKDTKWWRRPLSADSSRVDYLRSCVPWVKTWKFGSTRPPLCHAGLVLSIQSLLKLHQELMRGSEIPLHIKTKSGLPREPVLSHQGEGRPPVPPHGQQFSAALRSASVRNIVNMEESATHCIPDGATQLLQSEQEPELMDIGHEQVIMLNAK
ncbi:uncharacterized protein LOC143134015 [Alosa pseudoharengus]|uniref:uncharacterized protein LOC143134015 n=1 Tax=Alosa pseudoharengus TaxID=34774 RepID=UPI003F8A227C